MFLFVDVTVYHYGELAEDLWQIKGTIVPSAVWTVFGIDAH